MVFSILSFLGGSPAEGCPFLAGCVSKKAVVLFRQKGLRCARRELCEAFSIK
jgi:hypothetical protein